MLTHCTRCEAQVEGVYRHQKWRKIAYAYLLVPVPFLPIIPLAASDYVVSIPMMMLYMLGLGPVFAIVRDPPTCRDCGAIVRATKNVPR
jgi:hypothetical protein